MSELKRLKATSSLHDVAQLLGYKPHALSYVLYKLHPDSKYTRFEIAKRNGGKREIQAPCPELKKLQQRLSKLLQQCDIEIKKARNVSSVLAHGFTPKYSIITNAAMHKNRRFVFNLDLENFFGTINFGRVRGFFIKNRDFELNPVVATILAQIACHENLLPQGSPCSPVISNLVTHVLDIRLAEIAYKHGCTYSRYADDITFSTNLREFPSKIAQSVVGVDHAWSVGSSVEKAIVKAGFSINDKKSRMQYKQSLQVVTGLVVNKKVNVKSNYRRITRAMVDQLCRTGAFYSMQAIKNANGEFDIKKNVGTLLQVNGRLNFSDLVDQHNRRRINEPTIYEYTRLKANGFTASEKLYQRFLFYKTFYAADKPLILCEGKTDNIYIQAALRSLVDQFPELIEKKADRFDFKIRLFTYTEVAERILGLGGGTPHIKNFLIDYARRCDGYKSKGLTCPVIVLVDNDSGSSNFFSTFKLTKNDEEAFYTLSKNVRLVTTPLLAGKKTNYD